LIVTDPDRPGVVVIGVGNELRGDDGAGLAVARAVRKLIDPAERGVVTVRELAGDPGTLLDAWFGHQAVIVTDTMRSGAAPGTIRRVEARRDALPRRRAGRSSSTHGIGLEETIELGRALDRLPASLVIYAIEGARFDAGTGLSAEVGAAVPRLAQMVSGACRALVKASRNTP
jgi:hydrogenase maturation protease